MVRYFYITFIGVKREYLDPKNFMGSTGPKEESWKETDDEDSDDSPGIIKVPVPDYMSMTLISDSGMFVPAAVEDYIKESYKVDQVCIQFVREITAAEYQSQTEYLSAKADTAIATKMVVDAIEKSPIGEDTQLELDSLLDMASKGTLNVFPVDKDSEKEKGPWGDLFKPLDEDD